MQTVLELAMIRLNNLGYEDVSEINLELLYERAEEDLLSCLGLYEVPEELRFVFSDMIAGYYLKDILAKDGEIGTVKSIKEGDISIGYEEGSGSAALAEKLCTPDENMLARYRRIPW